MTPEYSGSYSGDGFRFAIVVSRFNEVVTSKLLEGAKDGLARHAVKASEVDIVWTPGAFEIPLTAKRLAQTGRYAAVICLGAVIRGATSHFEYVAGNAAAGVARAAMDTDVPIIFGILTTENVEQATERAGSKSGNKGFDAAMAALEMANLMRDIDQGPGPGPTKGKAQPRSR